MICRGTKSDGTNCAANAMGGSKYCFTHNPETKEQHLAATRKGGSVSPKSGTKVTLPRIPIDSPEAIISILDDAINRLRVAHEDGSMDAYTTNAISNLSGKLMEAYKLVKVTGKLKEMQETIDLLQKMKDVNLGGKSFEELLEVKPINLEVKPVTF